MAGRDDRTRRVVTAVFTGVLAFTVMAAPVRADSPETKVGANDSGVRIEIERKGRGAGGDVRANATSAARRRPAAASTASTRTVCRLVRVPASRNLAPRFRNGDTTRPLTPFAVVCNGRVTGLVWIDRSNGRRQTAASLGEQLVRDVPLPVGDVRVSPSERGLTGLESWFWVDGFDGTAVTATVNALGATVEVEATPIGYDWDFGDGVTHAGDLGMAAPQRSTVTHVYETTSTAPGFLVQLGFTYAIRYRINGGPWTTLPPITRHATRTYPVVEVRAQLTPQ